MAELLGTLALLGVALAASAWLAVRLKLPPAVGFLLVGVGFASVPSLHHRVPEHILHSLAEVGVLFLLFLIGLELDLKRLREALRATAFVTPLDVAAPAALVAVLMTAFGWTFQQSLAAGLALAISSTLFGERLTKSPGVGQDSRKRVLGVLIAEDVAAGLLLALLVVIGGGAEAAGGWFSPALTVGRLLFLMLLLTGAALLVVPRLLDRMASRHVHELVLLWAMGLVVLFAYLGSLAGSAELGALIAGVAAAEAGSRYVVRNSLAGLRDLALAVFFLASGLAVDAGAAIAKWPLVLGIVFAFLTAKLLVHVAASVAAGLDLKASLYTAIGLGTLGEFSLILIAVAEKEGLAHPDLRTVVVGAMVVLLILSSMLVLAVPRMVRLYGRAPTGLRRTLRWVAHAMRRRRVPTVQESRGRRRAFRILASNLVLLAALWLASAVLYDRFGERMNAATPFWGPVLFFGLVLALSLPLMIGAYRAYRELVWVLVGLQPGERAGAGRARARLVDAWTALTGFILLLFLALSVPQTLPVVIGAGLVALSVAALAWQQLNRFHGTLEGTLRRVLGEDPEAGAILDRVMQQYPWGVRFAGVPVPPDSPVAGRTVQGSRLAELTGAIVAVIQRRQREIVNPRPEEPILPGDTLVLLGDLHQLSRAEALVVAHGEALRLEAESRSAQIEEIALPEGSPWTGRPMGDLDIRDTTGTLVLGILHGEGGRPLPFDPKRKLVPGDRLILMGTPLQVERARRFAVPQDS